MANILNAPAEGFSQTISFAARREQDAPDAVGPGAVQGAGVQVAGSAGASLPTRQITSEPPRLAEFLVKVADAVIAPRLKEARTKAYVDGMQRAAAGEQLAEIAEDQPWYTKIFGDPAAVQGARVYVQNAKAAEIAASIEEAMPTLRSKSVAEANEHFTDLVNKALTGDDNVDAVLLQSLSRVLPGAMRKHAREHYQYQQEQAVAAQSTSILSSAKLLQGQAADVADGKIGPEEYELSQAEFAQSLIPPAGQDIESWRKARVNDIRLMAENGQFFAIQAARKAGLLEHLTPDQQATVLRTVEANEAQHRSRLATQYVTPLAEIGIAARLAPPGMSVNKLKDQIDALNADFSRRTGISTPLIGAFQEAQTMEQLAAGIQHRLEQQARDAAAKAQAAQVAGLAQMAQAQQAQGVATLYAAGQLNNYELAGMKRGQVEQYHLSRVLGRDNAGNIVLTNDPAELRATAVNATSGFVNSLLATQLQAVANTARVEGATSPAFLSAYADWKKLHTVTPGGAAAAKYYGEELDMRFRVFDQTANTKNPASMAAAFNIAFAGDKPQPVRFKDSEAKKAVDAAVSSLTPMIGTLFGETRKLAAGQSDTIAREIQGRMGYYGQDAEQAAAVALSTARDRGLQVFGGYAWKGPEELAGDGGMLKRMQSALTVSTATGEKPTLTSGPELARDFGKVMDGVVAELVGKPKSVQIAEYNGALHITAIGEDNQQNFKFLPWSYFADRVAAEQMARRPAPKGASAPAKTKSVQEGLSELETYYRNKRLQQSKD